MLWVAVAVMLSVGIVTLLALLDKHSSNDLGSVSARWIAEHRVDSR